MPAADAVGASERAHAANIYANKKNTRYNMIITEKALDLNYQSFIVESFGAFASDTWKFINKIPSVIRTPTPTPMTSTTGGTTPTHSAPLLSPLASPINVATPSCCYKPIVGVALSAPIVGTPRVNRTGRCTSQIVSRYCINIKK
eukprot:COSAG05_NODE_861_length_6899_cov_5.421618_4_plen_145_part_00